MLEVELGSYEDIQSGEAASLFVDHFCEVREHSDVGLVKCDPSWPYYKNLQDADALRVWLARYDGEVVGYCVMVLLPHPHSQMQEMMWSDSLYVAPRKRSTGAGLALIAAAEQEADEFGFNILWSVPACTAVDAIMARRKTYRPAMSMYLRKAQWQ